MKAKTPDANGRPHRWRRYPKYKPSGIEWLGEVPEGWEKVRLRFLCSIATGSKNTEDSDSTAQYPFFVRADTVERLNTFSFDEEAILTAGDGVGVAKVFHYYKGKFDAHQRVYVLTKFRKIWAPFLFHYFKQNLADEVLKLSAKSTVDSLRLPMLQNFPVLIPPPEEQRAIAAFLDSETARIDALIEKKERQIALLQEKRAALISHAVTKGLVPSVRMKESGIEWLGKIPSGWDMIKLKYIFGFVSGGTPSMDKLDYWDGDIPWVSPKDMKRKYLIDTEDHITVKGLQESSSSLIPAKSLLIVIRSGILKHTIPVSINISDMAINQDLKGLIPKNDQINSDFFAFFIQGHQVQLLAEWRKQGATVESLEYETIQNSMFPLPKVSVQNEIVAFLKKETELSEKISEKILMSINKLREYRSALISAAVTGKIDVRQEAKA